MTVLGNSVTDSKTPTQITPAELLALPWAESDRTKLSTREWMTLNPDGIYMSKVVREVVLRTLSPGLFAKAMEDITDLVGLSMRGSLDVLLYNMKDLVERLSDMPVPAARHELHKKLENLEKIKTTDVIPKTVLLIMSALKTHVEMMAEKRRR
jgi:hypothetical protein